MISNSSGNGSNGVVGILLRPLLKRNEKSVASFHHISRGSPKSFKSQSQLALTVLRTLPYRPRNTSFFCAFTHLGIKFQWFALSHEFLHDKRITVKAQRGNILKISSIRVSYDKQTTAHLGSFVPKKRCVLLLRARNFRSISRGSRPIHRDFRWDVVRCFATCGDFGSVSGGSLPLSTDFRSVSASFQERFGCRLIPFFASSSLLRLKRYSSKRREVLVVLFQNRVRQGEKKKRKVNLCMRTISEKTAKTRRSHEKQERYMKKKRGERYTMKCLLATCKGNSVKTV